MAKARDVDRALDQLGDALARKKHVVGLGRVPAAEGEGEWELAVYVDRKVPPEDLAPADCVPKTLAVASPKGEVEVRLRVIEQGVVTLE
jgi:hypothetical protein